MSKTTKIIATLGVVAGLGVAALPMGAFAADSAATQEVEVTVTIGESISIAIDGDGTGTYTDPNISVDMEQNSISEDQYSTISISTNSENGYKLTVKDSDDNTSLLNADDGVSTIPAGTSIAAGTAAWAIKGGLLTDYTAMVASDAEALVLAERDSATDGLETTTINYGFSTAPSQEQGAYKDTIVYTATKNIN